jgi:hypothetical protein
MQSRRHRSCLQPTPWPSLAPGCIGWMVDRSRSPASPASIGPSSDEEVQRPFEARREIEKPGFQPPPLGRCTPRAARPSGPARRPKSRRPASKIAPSRDADTRRAVARPHAAASFHETPKAHPRRRFAVAGSANRQLAATGGADLHRSHRPQERPRAPRHADAENDQRAVRREIPRRADDSRRRSLRPLARQCVVVTSRRREGLPLSLRNGSSFRLTGSYRSGKSVATAVGDTPEGGPMP